MVEDINADSSTAKRSQVTGHLLITMPKVYNYKLIQNINISRPPFS